MTGVNAGIVLNHIRNFMRDNLAMGLSETPVKVNHIPVLTVSLSHSGHSITKLSELTGLDKSSITRIVQQLVELDLVTKEGNPRQQNSVSLTDKGRRMAEMVSELEMRTWEKLFSGLDEDERDVLESIVRKLEDRLVVKFDER